MTTPEFLQVDRHSVRRNDAGYPLGLNRLEDPPEQLHVVGALPQGAAVALVGSRKCDAWAKRFTGSLAEELSARGIIVVSGGAAGVDTAAHEGALRGGTPTVAVLGSGLDNPYPSSNEELFSRIAAFGAVVSEFPPETPPTRWTFPKRNRIVAAMSQAVIVVQAARRSGALITARIASERGVPVGAVPGAVGDPSCAGCNKLIKGGAALVEGVDDVLELMGEKGAGVQLNLPEMKSRCKETPSKVPAPAGLTDRESDVYKALSASPVHIDDLAVKLDMPVAQVGAALLSLELSGLVEDRGQKHFVKR